MTGTSVDGQGGGSRQFGSGCFALAQQRFAPTDLSFRLLPIAAGHRADVWIDDDAIAVLSDDGAHAGSTSFEAIAFLQERQ